MSDSPVTPEMLNRCLVIDVWFQGGSGSDRPGGSECVQEGSFSEGIRANHGERA